MGNNEYKVTVNILEARITKKLENAAYCSCRIDNDTDNEFQTSKRPSNNLFWVFWDLMESEDCCFDVSNGFRELILVFWGEDGTPIGRVAIFDTGSISCI